ncbi:MAG: hypothetical protein R3C44_13790 [Chloroflexota bacterium]
MTQNQKQTSTLPSIWKTIAAGFELTTRHPWLLLIPVLLDVFLWLGPRLSFSPLVQQLLDQLPVDAAIMDPRPMLDLISTRTNMFTYLSVPLVGVPILMTGLTPEQTPTAPLTVDVANWGSWVGLLIGLTIVGLLLGAIYSTLIASVVVRSEDETVEHSSANIGALLQWIGRTWLRFGLLALLFLVVFLLIVLPISFIGAFVALISQILATFILFAAPVILLWVAVFLSYTPQGMTLNRKSFFPSLADSVRLFQANLLPALSLLLVVVLTRQLLGWLLLSADDGSWLTLVSLLGHAFVSTALSTAMLIFYHDRYRLLPDLNITDSSLEAAN